MPFDWGPDPLGYLAGFLSATAYLPQVIKTWRSRTARDLSLTMLILVLAGGVLWLWYGLWVQSMPVVATNGGILLMTGFILGMKLKFQKIPLTPNHG
ncbi:MAG: SemiSWEET transporter [Magnetococcales bacterium]|nr:SemiSWEET transporter [Magnetococcales bacterium]